MNLGDRLKHARETRKMSQDDLAKALGYSSRSTINKIEMGINQMPLDKIKKASEILEVNYEYLLGLWDELVIYPTTAEMLEGFDQKYNPNKKMAQEVKLLEQIQFFYGKIIAEAFALINLFNESGQKRILEIIKEMLGKEEYQKEG